MSDLFLVLYGHCGDVFREDREITLDLTYKIASFSLCESAAQAFGEAEKFILNKLAQIGFLFSCAKGRIERMKHSPCPLTRHLANNIKKYLVNSYTCKIIEWERIGFTDLLALYRDFEPFEAVLKRILSIEVSFQKQIVAGKELTDFFQAAYDGIQQQAKELLIESLRQLEIPSFSSLLSPPEFQTFNRCLEQCKRISSKEKVECALNSFATDSEEILHFLEQLSDSLDRQIWNAEIRPKCSQITRLLAEFYFGLDSVALEEHFLCHLSSLSNIRKQNLNSCDAFSAFVSLNADWDDLKFCKSSALFRTEFPRVSCCLFDNLPIGWNARLERIFHLVMAVKSALFQRKSKKTILDSLLLRFLVLLLEYIQTDVLLLHHSKFTQQLEKSTVEKVVEFEARFEYMLHQIEIGLFIGQDFVQQRFHNLLVASDAREALEQVKFLVGAMQETRISQYDICIAKFLNRVNFNEFFSGKSE
jgi:hypothetical protein